MVACHDFAIVDLVRIDVPKKNSRLVGVFPLHMELLVEIAIRNFAASADADRVAAHQILYRRWIKRADQQLHVLFQLVIVL
jgi:hypothetical protein